MRPSKSHLRRWLVILVAIVLTASACGGGDDESTDVAADGESGSAESDSSSSESSGDDSSSDEEAADSSDGGVIKWFEFYSPGNSTPNVEWMEMVAGIFAEENPGWSVEFESAAFDQLDQKSILDLETGVVHDVVFSSPQLMTKHQEAGDYIDLTPFIKETWSEEQIADLSWSAGWEAAEFGEVQLAVPTGVHVRGNLINDEVFAAAGLDPSTGLADPEAVTEAGIAIKEANAAPFGLGAFLGSTRATVEVTYAPLVWHYGGDFWEDDQPALASDASIQAVEWLWDAVNEHEIIPPFAVAADADYTALARDTVINGDVGQSTGFGSYWISALEDAGKISGCFPATADCEAVSVTPIPAPGSAGAGFANAWNLSIHANSENPDMAWALIEVAMRPENVIQFPGGGLPPWLSVYESEDYSSDFWQTWRDIAENGRGVPKTPFYAEFADAVSAALQEAINADRDEIPAILEAAQEEFVAAYLN